MPDQTPPAIRIWVCPQCGYWRTEHSTGVHVHFSAGKRGETHELEEAQYIFEGTTGRKGSA
jgi:cold shock CspA family protein